MPWRGPEVEGEFPTMGYIAADWIEDNLVLPDGPRMGQPFRLYDEQLNHLLHRGRLNPEATQDDEDALRYSGSVIVRGQKWGKDPILAAVDLFHAFGPCEFAGWDASGEPVGKPHPSPWVFVAALNDKQTDNTWIPLREMAKASPEIVDLPGCDVFDHMVRLPCGNFIEPVPTTAWGRLGGRFTAGSFTENGLLIGDGERGGLRFARTLKRSVTGMGGQWIAATNTWDPTEGSDAQLEYEAATRRNAPADHPVYVDAKLSRGAVDLENDEQLRNEIIYLYGDSLKSRGGHVSEQRIMRDVRNPAAGENEVRRFFLSEILSGERSAVDLKRWKDLAESKRPLKKGQKVALGFDGSRSRDATSLVAVRLTDMKIFHLKTWVPADHPGGKVPRLEVDAEVKRAFKTYDVGYLFADPFRWQDYLDVWAGRWPKKVVEFATNEERRMDRAIERFLTAYRNAEMSHDGDATLTTHAGNAALKKGKRKPPREDDETGLVVEYYLQIAKKREGHLIDAFVAAILAYAAAGKAIEDGALMQQDKASAPWVMRG